MDLAGLMSLDIGLVFGSSWQVEEILVMEAAALGRAVTPFIGKVTALQLSEVMC